ncbi:MAG: hypothetical protein LBE62_13020 [Azonexus sp.]|jgi:hypothetical protein|nr:hypothetical protein [Azonexus sp.]
MTTKTLYIRVQPKTGQTSFFRCGIQFNQAWQKVEEPDAATAARLKQEQMLEVSETPPEDWEAPKEAGDSANGGVSGTPANAPAKKTAAKKAAQ